MGIDNIHYSQCKIPNHRASFVVFHGEMSPLFESFAFVLIMFSPLTGVVFPAVPFREDRVHVLFNLNF